MKYYRYQEIHTTEDHAIWLEGKRPKRQRMDIHVGDIVRCRTGEPEKITNGLDGKIARAGESVERGNNSVGEMVNIMKNVYFNKNVIVFWKDNPNFTSHGDVYDV